MPRYAVIKPSVQIYFTPWIVVSENPKYVTKEKEQRMFAWHEVEGGHKIVSTIDRKLHRDGHTQWVSVLDLNKKECNSRTFHLNNEPLGKVQKFVMEQIKENNPKTLYKNHRKDIVWEGYKWKRA